MGHLKKKKEKETRSPREAADSNLSHTAKEPRLLFRQAPPNYPTMAAQPPPLLSPSGRGRPVSIPGM